MDITKIPQYELLEHHYVRELESEGYLMRHKKTGARVFVLENDDNNKVFNIAFRTVPTDSTGVAHIIEHTVADLTAIRSRIRLLSWQRDL